MTPERSQSYGRVIKTLEEIGPAKLLELERRRVRDAADTLLFAAGPDSSALEALADMEHLTRHLAESGRWSSERATQLADDVAACGPSMAGSLDAPQPAAA